MVVAHAYNTNTWRQRQENLRDFEHNPVYRARSRTARASTQRNRDWGGGGPDTETTTKIFPSL